MRSPEDELKRLLLEAELDLLERLRERCQRLETRVGDDPAMRESLRGVILDVLRDAGVRDHDRLARVLAPLVLTSMREEIRNSSDMMVDALYPITGRLVAAAVGNAFRELMETLNEKLDDSFSFDRWKIRLQAKATGRSEAELLLQRHPPFEIEDLLLIQRQTGLLIASGREQAEDDSDGGKTVDSDLVGAMLTAIMSFTRDALGSNATSELRTLHFGDSELFLRTSPAVILAVKARGTPPRGFEGALEALFGAFLERWGDLLRDYDGVEDEEPARDLITDLRARFRDLETARQQNFRGRSYKGPAALAVVALLLVGWVGFSSYQSWWVADVEATAREAVAAEPALAGYPIDVRFDRDADLLRVEGLVSDADVAARLERSLVSALPGVDAEVKVASLPRDEIERLAGAYEGVAERLTGLEQAASRLERSLAGAVTQVDGQTEALRQRAGDLEGLAGGLETSVDALSSRLASRLDQLEQQTGLLEQRASGFESSFEALSGSLESQLGQFEEKTKDLEGLAQGLGTSLDSVSRGFGDKLQQQGGELRGLADRIETSVDSWSRSLGGRLEQLDRRLAALEGAGPTPLDALQSWTARHAVFFAEGVGLKSPDRAQAKLSDLASLFLAAPPNLRLRVVGYSDASGGATRNRVVSLDRARSVAALLENLKVPAGRMETVGRAAERPLSSAAGRDSLNRRVEFEVIERVE